MIDAAMSSGQFCPSGATAGRPSQPFFFSQQSQVIPSSTGDALRVAYPVGEVGGSDISRPAAVAEETDACAVIAEVHELRADHRPAVSNVILQPRRGDVQAMGSEGEIILGAVRNPLACQRGADDLAALVSGQLDTSR